MLGVGSSVIRCAPCVVYSQRVSPEYRAVCLNTTTHKKGLRDRQYLVNLKLTPEQLERFYAGRVDQVWARDSRGVSLQFPLSALRPYVGHHGISGRFVLTVTDDHRLASIKKI